MSSIIESPWSEEASREICSGTEDGTSSDQSTQTDSSTALQSEIVSDQSDGKAAGAISELNKCRYCLYNDHSRSECLVRRFSDPKGAIISPFFVISCDVCGSEMKNDLQCPKCNCEMPGRLLGRICGYCDEYPAGHRPEDCPHKVDPNYNDYLFENLDGIDDTLIEFEGPFPLFPKI